MIDLAAMANAKLRLTRVELEEANEFIRLHHRHHKKVIGHIFSLGAAKNGQIVASPSLEGRLRECATTD